jgi:hypothetical protein
VAEVDVVMAREHIPAGPSVFLAGPTPVRGGPVPSWRPDAVLELQRQWIDARDLTVLSPESRGGRRAARYEQQWDWETEARARATVILFWIPRDMTHLPGLTTNTEFGYDIASGREVALGCPPDCPNPERNRYLIRLAEIHGAPVRTTLADTVAAALDLVHANVT